MSTQKITRWSRGLIGGVAVLLLLSTPALASLDVSYQFNGNGNWSLDGVGSNSTPVGDISAIVPLGSTIEKAFLYSSLTPSNLTPIVNFDGTTYSGAQWTPLGSTVGLQAFRVDVTSQVAAKIGGGGAAPFTFSILSETVNNDIDGEVLAIVYSNPAEVERTIAFLDGFSATTGDMTAINLADPLTAAQLGDPAFDAQMSLGIGFGFQPAGQFSQVDVNGQRLTTSAGGQDDGGGFNGGLITVGGIGDDPANPANPFATDGAGPRSDDELYTLTSFLSAGDTSITIDTLNPSNNDNIFFAGFNITARAGVNAPPPPPIDPGPGPGPGPAPIPEPSTVLLFGTGLLGLAGWKLRGKKQ